MVAAHLRWVASQRPDAVRQFPSHLDEETRRLVTDGLLATSWIPFRPARCVEASCQCAGDAVCLFELSW